MLADSHLVVFSGHHTRPARATGLLESDSAVLDGSRTPLALVVRCGRLAPAPQESNDPHCFGVPGLLAAALSVISETTEHRALQGSWSRLTNLRSPWGSPAAPTPPAAVAEGSPAAAWSRTVPVALSIAGDVAVNPTAVAVRPEDAATSFLPARQPHGADAAHLHRVASSAPLLERT